MAKTTIQKGLMQAMDAGPDKFNPSLEQAVSSHMFILAMHNALRGESAQKKVPGCEPARRYVRYEVNAETAIVLPTLTVVIFEILCATVVSAVEEHPTVIPVVLA